MAAKRQKRTRNEEVFKSSEDVPAQSPSGVKDNPEKPIVGREKREKGIADADERREKSEAVENGAVGVTEERQKQEVGEERKSFWLIKSEPHEYSLDMLKESPNATGFWDVSNSALCRVMARIFLRFLFDTSERRFYTSLIFAVERDGLHEHCVQLPTRSRELFVGGT